MKGKWTKAIKRASLFILLISIFVGCYKINTKEKEVTSTSENTERTLVEQDNSNKNQEKNTEDMPMEELDKTIKDIIKMRESKGFEVGEEKRESLTNKYKLDLDADIKEKDSKLYIFDKEARLINYEAIKLVKTPENTQEEIVELNKEEYQVVLNKLKKAELVNEDAKILSAKQSLDNYIKIEVGDEGDKRAYNPFDNAFITLDKQDKNICQFHASYKFKLGEFECSTSDKEAREAVKKLTRKELKFLDKIDDGDIEIIRLRVESLDHPQLEANKNRLEKVFEDNYFLAYQIELKDGLNIYLNPNLLDFIAFQTVE